MGKQKTNKNFLDYLCIWLSTLFGVGFLPVLGGTSASIVGAIIFFLSRNPLEYSLFTVLVLIISFPLSTRAERIFGEKDSKKIVIDDFAGMLLAFVFIPRKITVVILGFVIFRLFDFFKIYPANRVEELRGGLGVVGDDLVAGIYTNIIIQIFRLALNISS